MTFTIGIGILIFDLIVVIATMAIDYAVFLERKITNQIARWVIRLFVVGSIVAIVGAYLRWRQ